MKLWNTKVKTSIIRLVECDLICESFLFFEYFLDFNNCDKP